MARRPGAVSQDSQVKKKMKTDIPTDGLTSKRNGHLEQTSDLLEDGKAIPPVSWDMVRLEQKNKSILHFFSRKGTPATGNFGENSGELIINSGIKGQESEALPGSKGDEITEVINTNRAGSQASFIVDQLKHQAKSTDP